MSCDVVSCEFSRNIPLPMPYNFTAIEKKWQQYWLENKTFRALDPADAGDMPKAYVLDMFPYPSGAGLHVGHPEGYTATDIVSRYLRMTGIQRPAPDGLGCVRSAGRAVCDQDQRASAHHDREEHRELPPADPDAGPELRLGSRGRHHRPRVLQVDAVDLPADLQQLFRSDRAEGEADRAPDQRAGQRELRRRAGWHDRLNPTQEGMEAITGEVRIERLWRELSPEEQRDVIDGQRLAYMDEVPVNWCPGLGTVLANEEVIDGKSEVGGFPVERRPMRQWMLRITAYAERLLQDLDLLRVARIAEGDAAELDRARASARRSILRSPPDRRSRAAPDPAASEPADEEDDDDLTHHRLHDPARHALRRDVHGAGARASAGRSHHARRRIARRSRRIARMVAAKSDRDRMAETKDKTGVFTGAYAINPVNNEKIPIYIADYVLMGYGTGAIMAVPGARSSATGSSRRSSICRSSRSCSPTSGERAEGSRVRRRRHRDQLGRHQRHADRAGEGARSSTILEAEGVAHAVGEIQAARLALLAAALLG